MSARQQTARTLCISNIHGQVDGRVEAKTALVGTKGRVELDAVATVHTKLALIILPGDTELDDTLGDGANLEGLAVLGVLGEERAVLERRGELCRCRMLVDVIEARREGATNRGRPAQTQARRGGWT
jgi:hypothetical protein